MSLIQGFHHVCLKCCGMEEYEKVKYFYGEILGLPVARTWATGMMYRIGDGLIEIFNNGTESLPQGNIRHLALKTADVDACVAAVQAAGYTVFDGPRDAVVPSEPPYPVRVAFCRGPLEEHIEFFQERV